MLLAIVAFSYRQTIFAYPSGGGSYVVSRENLGETPSLVAGASLLVDYILTVAVSISAGVAAIISIPEFRDLADHRVALGLGLIAFITLANLRGVKESGRLFASPTYLYIVMITALVVYGLVPQLRRRRHRHGPVQRGGVRGHRDQRRHARDLPHPEGLLVRCGRADRRGGDLERRAGVPAAGVEERGDHARRGWRSSSARSSSASRSSRATSHPYPSHEQTVLAQMGIQVFGNGAVFFVLQIATAMILTLAANTAYADFPRLSSIIASDGYLPRQLANRGDRLVFSNGVARSSPARRRCCSSRSAASTNALIPLYAVGVFTSFTLSQAGMVRHHQHRARSRLERATSHQRIGRGRRPASSRSSSAITKFTSGAWVPIVVIPLIILLFKGIRRHYTRVGRALPDRTRVSVSAPMEQHGRGPRRSRAPGRAPGDRRTPSR